MENEFDIFERYPDGTVVLWDTVRGIQAARAETEQLAAASKNEFIAVATSTQDIAIRVNAPGAARG